MLAPACAGKDLLVSSQTGSGKTIAFGAALADTLLGEPPPPSPAPPARRWSSCRRASWRSRSGTSWPGCWPRPALRIGSFTGGTPVSGDLRALSRGRGPGDRHARAAWSTCCAASRCRSRRCAVVIWTRPTRCWTSASARIWSCCWKRRPPSVARCCCRRRCRRPSRRWRGGSSATPVRVDARQATGAATGAAHGDITYVAHLVNAERPAGGGRQRAASGGKPARHRVLRHARRRRRRMHGALSARGFLATAISGERAQAERDRALDQLRARGRCRCWWRRTWPRAASHLPDVDPIVHADLPLNADSLTHRSGRTGRAGRKGTAVVIAAPGRAAQGRTPV